MESPLNMHGYLPEVKFVLTLACEQVLPARNESLQQSWG